MTLYSADKIFQWHGGSKRIVSGALFLLFSSSAASSFSTNSLMGFTSSILHVIEVKLKNCIVLYCHIWSPAPTFVDIHDNLFELVHDRQLDLRNSVNSSARDKFDTRPLRCQRGDTRAVCPTAEGSGGPYISEAEASEYTRALPCYIPTDLSRNRLQLYIRPSCNSNEDWIHQSITLTKYR